ncbi:MAG: hypothetical protein AAF725_02395 [Acidobacteriota bacterium]
MATPSQEPSEDLAARLRRAPSRELLPLLESHGRELTLREVRQTLLNPFVDGRAIEALAINRRLTTIYEVRAALARHHRTPETVSMRFIAGLFWRDLSEITLDGRLRAAVRRAAARYLVQRLPRLTQGEKITLARRSAGDIAAALLLLEDRERLTAAALDNPRLDEKSLIGAIRSPRASPRMLDTVARHERWRFRYEIRAALCLSARTPYRVVLRHLESLAEDDLAAVAASPEHSQLIRGLAEDTLETVHAAPRTVIGLESGEQRSSPRRADAPEYPGSIADRFDLDRGDDPGTGHSTPSELHEKDEKAYQL